MRLTREVLGEAMGTFVLTLFGCGSVAGAVLFDSYSGLFQIAMAWGIGVTLAIYLTRHLSCAHLNPAVSLAMAMSGRMARDRLPRYVAAQFAGAFAAALVLYALFGPSIGAYEASHGIVRGTAESIATAKMFGEFFPAPGGAAVVSLGDAMFAEGLGTFLLVLMIFALTEGCNVGRPDDALAPVFIGLTVASVICLVAPLTQAGLNPARDFAPRLAAYVLGWGRAAFPVRPADAVWVYVAAPLLGAAAASLTFTRVVEPRMRGSDPSCSCGKRIDAR
jgi:glycerol uptake facilitator protein